MKNQRLAYAQRVCGTLIYYQSEFLGTRIDSDEMKSEQSLSVGSAILRPRRPKDTFTIVYYEHKENITGIEGTIRLWVDNI